MFRNYTNKGTIAIAIPGHMGFEQDCWDAGTIYRNQHDSLLLSMLFILCMSSTLQHILAYRRFISPYLLFVGLVKFIPNSSYEPTVQNYGSSIIREA